VSNFGLEDMTELVKTGVLIIYHTCETSLPHLKLQIQIPASAVNVGEGASIAAVKRDLGTGKCLTGNLDPLLLRDGSSEQVVEATDKMVDENLPGGGYVFNTGEGIMQNSPPENVKAMMRTARATLDRGAGTAGGKGCKS